MAHKDNIPEGDSVLLRALSIRIGGWDFFKDRVVTQQDVLVRGISLKNGKYFHKDRVLKPTDVLTTSTVTTIEGYDLFGIPHDAPIPKFGTIIETN